MMISTEHGFTLIEVLISVFVLAVGVIGAAGMQLTALRTTQQSALHTRALYLAGDMAELMRANSEHMRLAGAANAYLQVDYQAPSTIHHPSGQHCYGTTSYCDAEQLAHFDIAELLQRIAADFPGGRIRICRDMQPWNTSARGFEWDCTPIVDSTTFAPVVIKIGWQANDQDGGQWQDQAVSLPRIVLTVVTHQK